MVQICVRFAHLSDENPLCLFCCCEMSGRFSGQSRNCSGPLFCAAQKSCVVSSRCGKKFLQKVAKRFTVFLILRLLLQTAEPPISSGRERRWENSAGSTRSIRNPSRAARLIGGPGFAENILMIGVGGCAAGFAELLS